MKRPYELMFVVRTDPNEEVMRESIEQIHQWVEEDELGTITKVDHWGRRKLAYEIDSQREGYYVLMEADIDTNHLEELERNLKLSADVLRYLIVRPDS